MRKIVPAVAVFAAATLVVTGCSSQRSGGDGGDGAAGKTFTFAASSDPATLDPAFASDGETFRVARQMFEGLVGTVPGKADPAPLLAKSWQVSPDGLSYTFDLQSGVKFHDDTDFNADAVCFNFNRWNNFTGIAASESLSYYWGKVNGGYAATGGGKYKSCQAVNPTTATITLNSPLPEFVAALSLPAFSMQSPKALQDYDADNVGGEATAPSLPAYSTAHPTGTGPFTFGEWKVGEQVTLNANPNYWGDKGQVSKIVFPVIDEPTARRQALEAGDIDGYDLVAAADIGALKDKGFEIVNRDPFNILYLGMNQAIPALQDIRVRQAIAYAIDREALVAATLPEGTKVATNFVPPSVKGYNENVTKYPFDRARARQLLAEAGQSNLTINFTYPTNVSRPYMPTPVQVFERIAADLKEVGITVEPKPLPWSPDYLDTVQGGPDHGLHLLGWTGDYNDTFNFIGVFFGAKSNEWGFDNPAVFNEINSARVLPNIDEQTGAYSRANASLLEFLPGVPIAHPVPSLAFRNGVVYPASPVQDEVYNMVELPN